MERSKKMRLAHVRNQTNRNTTESHTHTPSANNHSNLARVLVVVVGGSVFFCVHSFFYSVSAVRRIYNLYVMYMHVSLLSLRRSRVYRPRYSTRVRPLWAFFRWISRNEIQISTDISFFLSPSISFSRSPSLPLTRAQFLNDSIFGVVVTCDIQFISYVYCATFWVRCIRGGGGTSYSQYPLGRSEFINQSN